MDTVRPLRSALYTPGDQASVLAKAAKSAADALIFDLEDAVAPERKAEARRTVAQALAEPVLAGRFIAVRVNALGSAECADDVAAAVGAGAAAVLFPKVGSAADVAAAQALLDAVGAGAGVELWAMIETPIAILNAAAIGAAAARPGSRLSTFVLGSNDLVKEMRGRSTASREALVPAMSTALLAARAFGLAILDGVHNDIADADGFAQSCAQGRAMGFDGRTLIHPAQIAPCHLAYTPSAEELREARAIVDAFARPENAGRGVVKLDGRMVERLHAEMAARTVALAAAIEASGRG